LIPSTPPKLAYQAEPQVFLSDDGDRDLLAYVQTLSEQRWLVFWIALAVLLGGTLYALMASPVYEASLMLHVEEKGQREPKNILGEAGSMFDYKTPAAAEVELLRSRLVVARAIDREKLYIDAHPQRVPLLGNWLVSSRLATLLPVLQGLGGYAWGDEHIALDDFSVPELLENREFTLLSLRDGRYIVTEPDAGVWFEGRVGVELTALTRYGPVLLKVDTLQAAPGTRFSLLRSSRLSVIEGVQKSLDVAEIGKQSGVVLATLKGATADGVYRLLSGIAQEYMAQNGARRTEEADKSLAWLSQRLPELKQQLEQAEARYNHFRHQHGTVDIGEEGRINLQRSAAVRTRKVELEQKRLELLSRYTASHPAVMAVDDQLRDVNRELRDAASQLRELPVLEQEMVKLARDVKVNNELYGALLSSAQQLQLIKVGKTSNVRLVDAPEKPTQPVTPNRPRIIAVSAFAGLFLGVLAAFLRRSLQSVVDDPEDIERGFGLPVYASIPHSAMQQTLADNTRDPTRLPLLARVSSMDIAVEGLRNFRTALQVCLTQASNRVVLITGPTEGMGKSFVSVNLASIIAAGGRRVLLIDGDLRDGQLHRYFHSPRSGGLSDILAGAPPAGLVRRSVLEQLDFIATGSLPPNPSELLLRPALAAMLAELEPHYDVVLIDAAPLLAVADSLVIGAHAGTIFLATRYGVTRPGEIAEAMKRLARAGLSARGVLFNDIIPRPGRYAYGGRYGYGKLRQLGYSTDAQRSLPSET
jgi:tyrosine-protein kinase Etk/Wzc